VDPELIEQFFKLYLDENKIDYALNKEIYTVKRKTKQKHFELNKFTFNPRAVTKTIQLIQPGNSILDSAVSKYGSLTISNLKITHKKNDILELNEKLFELNKQNVSYKIEECTGHGQYILFELIVNTVKHRKILSIPLLIFNNQKILAEQFVNANFTLIKKSFEIKKIKQALAQITNFSTPKLEKAEKEHKKDMEELLEIQFKHAENQYAELKKQEDKLLNKINDLHENSLSAASFSLKNKYSHQKKSLKKKHELLIKKNKTKRNNIKKLFDKQMEELKTKKLNVESNIIALAKVEFNYFLIKFADKEEFYYFSFLKKFEKKNKEEKK
jgi:hypothetical protein